jgi:hypothetical protein
MKVLAFEQFKETMDEIKNSKRRYGTVSYIPRSPSLSVCLSLWLKGSSIQISLSELPGDVSFLPFDDGAILSHFSVSYFLLSLELTLQREDLVESIMAVGGTFLETDRFTESMAPETLLARFEVTSSLSSYP